MTVSICLQNSLPDNFQSHLFETPWGEKYKSFQGKVFQLIPSNDPMDFLESTNYILASLVYKTKDNYIIKQRGIKVPYGAFAIYLSPLILKIDIHDENEPILFGHFVMYQNCIILVSAENIDSPYRGGW